MVFCNDSQKKDGKKAKEVTILILVDGFLQSRRGVLIEYDEFVTILILVDGFLQLWKS